VNLNGVDLGRYSQSLISLSQAVGEHDFYPILQQVLAELLPFDECLVLHLSKQHDAQLLFRFGRESYGECQYREKSAEGQRWKESGDGLRGEDFWKYLTRLYVLDPFYRLFADQQAFGFFGLTQIAPDEFENIYHAYFNFLELADEVGYLFEIGDGSCLHVDISRFGSSGVFSNAERSALKQLYEPLSLLIKSHINSSAVSGFDTRLTDTGSVESVLLNFGKQVFTNKEYQTCQLLLQGHSTKAIANIMGIGAETVKMHKKNVYGKATLSTQSELLALFIDILQQVSLDPHIDHLAHYLSDG